MAPVFAASSTVDFGDEALKLYGLGLFKGTSEDSYEPDLESPLTREQAIVILLRLIGEEDEALAMTEAEVKIALAPFKDVNLISDWARNQVAYAVKKGIMKGYEGLLDPQGGLKGIQFASLLLQAIGVTDFEYYGALEKLVVVGAFKNEIDVVRFDKEQLIRDDVVGMAFPMLTVVTANGKTMIENLIAAGEVDRAAAKALGLIEAAPVVTEEPVGTEEPVVTDKPVVTEKPVAKEAKVEFKATPAQSIAQGQNLFEIGKLVVTADEKDITVSGLKIARSGLSADTNIKSITVWNGTEKVNSIGIFSNSVANVAFTKNVVVKAGESLELAVKMNVADSAKIGAELKLSITEVRTSEKVNASYPMVGNKFVIAPADIGTLTATLSGDAPTANINAGDKDVRLAKYNFAFGKEAQVLKQIILTQDGTISDSDLANLRLVDEDGAVLAEGEMKNGEVCFLFEKEYTSGSTARLTVRGDVLGGAGRTVLLTINNVNDVQSVGKTYGTTISLNSVLPAGNTLTIEKGTLVLTKAASSPATVTIADNTDDQLVASIKIEAIGEPVQLETIGIDFKGTDLSKLKEVKVLNNNRVVASQEVSIPMIPATATSPATKPTATMESLPLSEVIEVVPGTPIVLDIAMDTEGSAVNDQFTLGLYEVTGTGLISGKDVNYNDSINPTCGNPMNVGKIEVTVEQKPQVDGYVFQNQSSEKVATFMMSHNLGEAVKLTSVTINVGNGTSTPVTAADVANTFKNVKLVKEDGTDASEVIGSPNASSLKLALKEGIAMNAGEKLKLTLVSDIKSSAVQNDKFSFYVQDATAVVTRTGNTIVTSGSTDSRTVTISTPVATGDVTAKYSTEGDLENKNVLRKQNGVKLAQWTLTNSSSEDVKVNKIYLTADYSQVTGVKEISEALKDVYEASKATKDAYTFEEIPPVTISGNLYAAHLDGAPVIYTDDTATPAPVDYYVCADKQSSDYGKFVDKNGNVLAGDNGGHMTFTATLGNLKAAYLDNITVKGDGKELARDISLVDGKGKEVKFTSPVVIPARADNADGEIELIVTANISDGAQFGGQVMISIGDAVTGDLFEATGSVTGTTYTESGALIPAGKNGTPLKNTIAITKIEPMESAYAKSPLENVAGQTVGVFKLNNVGETKVTLSKIKLNVLTNITSNGINGGVTKLELFDKDKHLVDTQDIVTVGNNSYVEFNLVQLANRIQIAKGASHEFEVRLSGAEVLDQGETIQLSVDKEGTVYDDVNGIGYEISIDKEITLGAVTAVKA